MTAHASHPRLLFDQQSLDTLRKNAETGIRAKALKRLLALADGCLSPQCPFYFDYKELASDMWRTRHGIFQFLPSIFALAAAYSFTGDRRYGNAAREAMMTVIDKGLADVEAVAYAVQTKGWRHGPGHDKGKYAQHIALVFDMCYDCFSDEDKAKFVQHAQESIGIAEEFARFDMDQVANNRGSRGLLGKTWLCLAVEGELGVDLEMEKICSGGKYVIDLYLYHAHAHDGAPYEGAGYAGCLHYMATLSQAIGRRGFGDQRANNRYERFLDYLMYELIPGGGGASPLNDCHDNSGSVTGSMHLMSEPRGALLPWLAQQLDLHPSRETDMFRPELTRESIAHAFDLFLFLLWWDDEPSVKTPEELGYPLSHNFHVRGIASHRSGWDKQDTLISHFCGRQQRRCHRQGDYNHFNYYALGETFLADAGYGHARASTKAVDRWYSFTNAHNCVTHDGEHFRSVFDNAGWAEGEILDFQQQEGFSSSLGDASGASGPNNTVRRALRRIVLVREGPVHFVAVIDVNEKDGKPFDAKTCWQTEMGNTIETGTNGFVIQGQTNQCVAQVLYPDKVEFTFQEHYDRQQARMTLRDSVVETVTIFCPVTPGYTVPTFACKRHGEGDFSITAQNDNGKTILRASAVIRQPLRQADPVQLQIS